MARGSGLSHMITIPIIIAGSRSITDLRHVDAAIKESKLIPFKIISGCANGVDKLGEMWAKQYNVQVIKFPADWNLHGNAAGPIRNCKMVDYAFSIFGGLIAIWDGKSRGTEHIIGYARLKQLKHIFVYNVNQSINL